MKHSTNANDPVSSGPLVATLDEPLVKGMSELPVAERLALLESLDHQTLATLWVLVRISSSLSTHRVSQRRFHQLEHEISELLDQGETRIKSTLVFRLMGSDWVPLKKAVDDGLIKLTRQQPEPINLERESRTLFYRDLPGPSILHRYEQQDHLSYLAKRNPDESMNIEGFAGSGKTMLTLRLAHVFNEKGTYLLTKNLDQRAELAKHLPEQVKILTWDWLIEKIYGSVNAPYLWQGRINRRYDIKQFVTLLGLEPQNGLSPEQAAGLLDRILFMFCQSADTHIQEKHFPWDYLLQLNISEKDRFPISLYLQQASELWERMMVKGADCDYQVSPLHVFKFLVLTNHPLVYWIKRLIVDESHDLPPVIADYLKRGQIPIIGLGDHYQITDHRQHLSLEKPSVTFNTLSLSVRSGDNLSDTFNAILQQHQITPPELFSGNKNKTTQILLYDLFEPGEAQTILTGDYWYACYMILVLFQRRHPFSILGNQKAKMKSLLISALQMYQGHPCTRLHSQLIHFNNWQDLVENQGYLNGLLEIDQLFKSNLKESHIESAFRAESRISSSKAYQVGLIADSKSREFVSVMLAPDVVCKDLIFANNKDTDRKLNLLYTGLSRATETIHLPRQQSRWILQT